MTPELQNFIQSKDVRLFVLSKAIAYIGECVSETPESYEIINPICIHHGKKISHPSFNTLMINKNKVANTNALALGLPVKKFYYDQLLIVKLKALFN